jgi:hypothetical protein
MVGNRRKIIVEITVVVLVYGLTLLTWFAPSLDSIVLHYDLPPVAIKALSYLMRCIFAAVAMGAMIYCFVRPMSGNTKGALSLAIGPAVLLCLLYGVQFKDLVQDQVIAYRFWEKNSLTLEDVALFVRDVPGTFSDNIKVPTVSADRFRASYRGVLRHRVQANSDGQTYEQYPAREGGYYRIYWLALLRHIEYRGPTGDTRLIWHENEVRLMNGEVVKWE